MRAADPDEARQQGSLRRSRPSIYRLVPRSARHSVPTLSQRNIWRKSRRCKFLATGVEFDRRCGISAECVDLAALAALPPRGPMIEVPRTRLNDFGMAQRLPRGELTSGFCAESSDASVRLHANG